MSRDRLLKRSGSPANVPQAAVANQQINKSGEHGDKRVVLGLVAIKTIHSGKATELRGCIYAAWHKTWSHVRPPPSQGTFRFYRRLSNCDLIIQIYILNRIQQFNALFQRPLERLSAADQAHTTGTLVDNRGSYRLV